MHQQNFLWPVISLPQTVTAWALALALLFPMHGAHAGNAVSTIHHDWYVDGLNGSDANPGISATAAFKTPWKAWLNAHPGDTIHLLPTIIYGPQYFAGRTGTASAPITIQGDGLASNRTKVSGRGENYGVMIGAGTRYVIIRNLDITAPGPYAAIWIMQGNHINVLKNYLHDSGAAGVSTNSSDYITIDGNIVSYNAKYTAKNSFGSGISTGESVDSDRNIGIKMIIKNNIVYGNTNVRAEGCTMCYNSDGSGIIIDDNRRTQTDHKPYRGATLIENNIVYGNGGRGIHIYLSDNVTARGNTVYSNNQDPYEIDWHPGEIEANRSGNVQIYHNILYSDGRVGGIKAGQHYAIAIKNSTHGGPIIAAFNVSYNPQNNATYAISAYNNRVPVSFISNRWGNPRFKRASLNPAVANFRILKGSAALGFASPDHTYPVQDILGFPRTRPVTAGAYQQLLTAVSPLQH